MRKIAALLLGTALIITSAAAAQDETEYRVRYADTLDVIAQEMDVSVACLAGANDLTNANQLTFGQILIIPADCDPYDSIESIIISNVDDLEDFPVLDTGLGRGGGAAQAADDAADEDAEPLAAEADLAPAFEDDIYVVQAGDNLTEIAEQFATSAICIQTTNNIVNPDLIFTGQELLISADCQAAGGGDVLPGAARQCFSDRNAGRVVNGGVYIVQEGDTLDFIGCDLGLSTTCLAALNELPNNGGRLVIGQSLTISTSCAGWDGPPGPGDLAR